MQRVFGWLITLTMSTLMVTACSSAVTTPAGVSDDAQQVTLDVGNSLSFEPAAISVRAGQPVRLVLRNTGLVPHDFSLSDGVAQPVRITAAGGQTASGTFTIEQPGTYSFECSMPGHASGGMRGTLTAT
jgi:uncharacterized cupredoxin-like copper-binding protein